MGSLRDLHHQRESTPDSGSNLKSEPKACFGKCTPQWFYRNDCGKCEFCEDCGIETLVRIYDRPPKFSDEYED